MATKQSTKSRSGTKSSGTTRKSASSKTGKRSGASVRGYKAEYEQRVRARRQAGAVILFTVGILVACVAAFPGANVWLACHDFLYGMFGMTVWAIPVVFIYIAVMATLDKPLGEIHNKLWQTAVLVILICGLLEICADTPFAGDGFFGTLIALYQRGVLRAGGGFFAALVGWPLYVACGKAGSIIIISLFLFASVMLLTGATLAGLFRAATKPVRKANAIYSQHREEARLVEEERARVRAEEQTKSRFGIDVDLGPDPVLPEHPVTASPSVREAEAPVAEKPEEEKLAEEKRVRERIRPVEIEVPESSDRMEDRPSASSMNIFGGTMGVPGDAVPLEELVEKAAGGGVEDPVKDPLIQVQPVFDNNDQAKLYPGAGEGGPAPYVFPPITLLKAPKGGVNQDVSAELKANADLLVDTLKSFGVQTKIIDISRGPTVTRYELQPMAGVKISKITGLADDIALNLAAAGVRIEAPIPNKAAVGIEVPNRKTDIVTMREIIESREFERAESRLATALGRDIAGNPVVTDIAKMPHVLIAGATGSGKSVCINSIIVSLLYKASPDEVRFLMIDPKVVELGVYNGIPHLLVPVVTDPRKAAGALGWAVTEMLNRYKLFADNNVRDLGGYNALTEGNEELTPLPQIVVIIDELADLMMAAPNEVEDSICRLAQMARAAGMHLVIATQRPSVDVITGIIKANIPSRIAFAVSSQVDSRTILDSGGAEKLLGRGDMLFYPVGMPKPIRVQGCFVSDKEVEQVVDFIKNKETADYDERILEEIDKQAAAEKNNKDDADGGGFDAADEMLDKAIECVIEAGQASTSFLQRKLKVGYARAARLVDDMEERGIVGPFEGSKPRQVLITRQQWIEMNMRKDNETSGS